MHSPRVEGVHLRKGPIARGGIRWSERPEDFRTEILGLMKAQHVKNTLIVPVGAKGGFVARRLPPRARARAAAARSDRVLPQLHPRPARPHRQHRRRPRRAAAARCGASMAMIPTWWWRPTRARPLSPTSPTPSRPNTASGSAMRSPPAARPATTTRRWAITARGAWECIKRHFRELGSDIQREPFTVAGIGDMSGDVFGNGMLLSRQIRLVAAFNHQHIFLDPNPDAGAQLSRARAAVPAAALGLERLRPRACCRAAAAIFERSAKSVTLSREAQALLDLPQRRATPGRDHPRHSVHAGRSAVERRHRHLRQGLRASATARSATAPTMRCASTAARCAPGWSARAATSASRSAAASNTPQRGGRINADFIDNSAGVNTSDVEVNLKILLDAPDAEPPMPRSAAQSPAGGRHR